MHTWQHKNCYTNFDNIFVDRFCLEFNSYSVIHLHDNIFPIYLRWGMQMVNNKILQCLWHVKLISRYEQVIYVYVLNLFIDPISGHYICAIRGAKFRLLHLKNILYHLSTLDLSMKLFSKLLVSKLLRNLEAKILCFFHPFYVEYFTCNSCSRNWMWCIHTFLPQFVSRLCLNG